MEAVVAGEDALDVELGRDKGMIERGPTPDCRHNARSKCSRCLPLDPFDAGYLAEKEIKHMSFHAYVRKVMGTEGRSSVLSYPLEAPVCRVKPCSGHPPYPAATCVKCLPDPIILARQPYRHVDNVAFESPELVDAFLDSWRESGGAQRAGILLGRYERHPDVPLGIRANVVAIFEPPQTSSPDSLKLESWEGGDGGADSWLSRLEDLASLLELRPLGWLLTDLVQVEGGKFHHSRDGHRSFLVSAQECITAAALQNRFPNACRLSATGVFGSKFVTVIVSGDREGGMEFRGWQMSNQAAALVADGWLVPTAGTPDLAFVRNDRKAIPDVKFSTKDKYGNTVTKDARPFPVEYLLVDVPAGASADGLAKTFNPMSPPRPKFPIANRMGHDLAALGRHLNAFSASETLALFTDFHLLHFLAYNEHERIPMESMARLAKAIRSADASAVSDWASKETEWAQLKTLAEAAAHSSTSPSSRDDLPKAGDSGGGGGSNGGEEWACQHCTFHNPSSARDCQICSLPRN